MMVVVILFPICTIIMIVIVVFEVSWSKTINDSARSLGAVLGSLDTW